MKKILKQLLLLMTLNTYFIIPGHILSPRHVISFLKIVIIAHSQLSVVPAHVNIWTPPRITENHILLFVKVPDFFRKRFSTEGNHIVLLDMQITWCQILFMRMISPENIISTSNAVQVENETCH